MKMKLRAIWYLLVSDWFVLSTNKKVFIDADVRGINQSINSIYHRAKDHLQQEDAVNEVNKILNNQ